MRPSNRRPFTLVVFALLVATTACAADPGVGTTTTRPPSVTATADDTGEHHGGGLALNTQAPPVPSTASAGSLPDSVDLSRFNPPVGDQGVEAKCTAWATGYYLRGWYAKRDGYYPASDFSADFTYLQAKQYAGGATTFADNLDVQVTEGLDTLGDFNLSHHPTSPVSDAAITNAVRYKIAGYTDYRNTFPGLAFEVYIKQQLASQTPLAIGITTSPQFDNLSATSPSDLVTDTSSGTGLHALFAYGYDQKGLLVENEWGISWGYNGYAELSWAYVMSFGHEAISITPLVPTVPVWQRLPGSATAIGVGADGSVWSLGTTQVPGGYGIYHWDASTWTWSAIPGGALRLAVDPSGNPWIVNNAGNILHWDGTAWQQLPGVARDIAFDEYGDLWMVSGRDSGQTGCPTSGCGTGNPLAAHIGRGAIVSTVPCTPTFCDGSIFSWTGSAWKQMPGAANRIAVDATNAPWVVSSSGVVSYYYVTHPCGLCTQTPTSASWISLPPPAAKALAIAPLIPKGGDSVWAAGMDGNLLRWNWDASRWDVIQDAVPALAIASSPRGNPWVVNVDGSIYQLPSWDDM